MFVFEINLKFDFQRTSDEYIYTDFYKIRFKNQKILTKTFFFNFLPNNPLKKKSPKL